MRFFLLFVCLFTTGLRGEVYHRTFFHKHPVKQRIQQGGDCCGEDAGFKREGLGEQGSGAYRESADRTF